MDEHPRDTLAMKNKHPRDDNIKLEKSKHIYTIEDGSKTYTSVTEWYSSFFSKFNADTAILKMMNSRHWDESNKYWGMTPAEIKLQWKKNRNQVSQSGTNFHACIDAYMNGIKVHDPIHSTVEWNQFLKFVEDTPDMVPYRTEWMIYDEELLLAGSIDMVYINLDGSLTIVDWKRVETLKRTSIYGDHAIHWALLHIPDTNFWHYALQLNAYKAILERKYGKVVKELKLVRCHPTIPNYEIVDIPIMEEEMERLLDCRKLNLKNSSNAK